MNRTGALSTPSCRGQLVRALAISSAQPASTSEAAANGNSTLPASTGVGVQPQLHRGDDAEVAASAAQGPEQLGLACGSAVMAARRRGPPRPSASCPARGPRRRTAARTRRRGSCRSSRPRRRSPSPPCERPGGRDCRVFHRSARLTRTRFMDRGDCKPHSRASRRPKRFPRVVVPAAAGSSPVAHPH